MVAMKVQRQLLYPVLSEADVAKRLDPDDPACAFHESRYVGNRAAVDEILDVAHAAFQTRSKKSSGELRCPRRCPNRIALLGPPSVGKTTFAKTFGHDILQLPFCACLPEQVTSAAALFELLELAYAEMGVEIEVEEERGDTAYYVLPAGVLLIDEVHLLSGKVQDSLLSVTESNDGTLRIDDGIVDCRNLTIIINTTDKGKLRTAFKTRFRHIHLKPYTTAEIAKIVQINQPKWSAADCAAVASLKSVAREARDFALAVNACVGRRRISVREAIQIVRDREGITEGGINVNARRTLELLAGVTDGLSRVSLCVALNIEEEEFENDVLPCLVANERHPAYIAINHRHVITDAGRAYLEKLKGG